MVQVGLLAAAACAACAPGDLAGGGYTACGPNGSSSSATARLLATGATSAGAPDETLRPDSRTHRAYGANTNSKNLYVIDDTTDLSSPLGSVKLADTPWDVAVDEGRHRAYVVTSSNLVQVDISSTNLSLVGNPLDIPGGGLSVALDEGRHRAYVPNSSKGLLYVVDVSTDDMKFVGTPLQVGTSTYTAAVDAGNHRVYVPQNSASGLVTVVDGAANPPAVLPGAIKVGPFPYGAAVDFGTHRVYTGNEGDGTISVIDGCPRTPAVRGAPLPVHPAAPSPTKGYPTALAVDGKTHLVYSVDWDSGDLFVLDGARPSPVVHGGKVPVGQKPRSVGMDQGNGRVFVRVVGGIAIIDGRAR